jgi:ketopantoate hydroxymethyltransferase
VKQYGDLGRDTRRALEAYAADVRTGAFPESHHTYAMPDDERTRFLADG